MTAQRPALADVLAVLTIGPSGSPVVGQWPMWTHPTPADALAALVEAELLPEHWADEGRAPRWWCEACGGTGRRHTPGVTLPVPCFACWDGMGHTAAPPSHAAIVAVASLGVDTLARAEAIVAETWPGARLVWRVMTAEELSRVAFWFACEAVGLWSDRWPEEFRFWSASDAPPEAVALMDERRRLHPTLRALAVTEDGKPTGLCLVALDDARVVLAVEAL